MAAQKVKIGTAVLELTTDSTGVISGLKLVDAEFDKKGKTISAKAVAMGAAIGTAVGGLALAAIKKVGAELQDIATRGITMAPVVTSFHNLTAAVNQSADAMLGAGREGAAGLIADLDLMQAGNKALLLGLPLTEESMGTMAKAAVVLGKAMNEGPTKSFDDLITALGRSSPMILDNLGLSVKVGEANEKYAASIGKTAEQLTDAEKKTAFYNAAMEAAKRKVEEVGGVQLTLRDRFEQVKVKLTNVTDALGVAIAKSPVLAAGFDALGAALSDAVGTDQTQLVQTLIGYINDFAIKLVSVAQGAVFLARGVGAAFAGIKTIFLGVTTVLAGVVLGLGAAVEGALNLASKIPGVGSAFDGAIASVHGFNEKTATSMQELAGMTAEAAKGVIGQDAFGRSLDTVGETLATMKARMIEASSQQVNLKDATQQSTQSLEDHAEAQKKAAAEAKKLEEIAQKERDALKSMGLITQRDVNTELEELTKLQERATKEGVPLVAFLRAAESRLKDMADKAKIAGVQVDDLTDALRDVQAELNRLDPKPVLDLPRLFEQGKRGADLMLQSMKPVTAETLEAGRQATVTKNAYQTLGIDTQRSLRETYEKFDRAYRDMAASGTATEGELREAWRKVKEAGIAAGLETQSVWETSVLSAITDVVGGISRSVGDGVVELIGHWNRHKDVGKAIWGELLDSVKQKLADVLSYFVNSFLTGMLNAIMGQQAPFATAFGSLFRANTGGAGGLGTVISLTDPKSMAGAGAGTANAFLSGLSQALYAGAAAYGIYKFWDIVIGHWTGGPSPERFPHIIGYRDGDPNQPVYGTGIEEEEGRRRGRPGGTPDKGNPNNPFVDDQGNAYQPGDPNANVPDPNVPPGTSMPGSGYTGTDDYDRGTPNYDFKRFRWGQPVRVHGEEAIIPRGGGNQLAREIAAAMPASRAGNTYVLNAPNALVLDGASVRSALQRFAEVFTPVQMEHARDMGFTV